MSDSPKDRTKVNVNEPADIAYWCDKFGCSQTQLRTAVKVVGTSPNKVRTHLADRK
jgi:AraC-like DNA-binding protein